MNVPTGREFQARFENLMTGLVFYGFERATHVAAPVAISAGGSLRRSLDFKYQPHVLTAIAQIETDL